MRAPASTAAVQQVLLRLGGRRDTRVFRNNVGLAIPMGGERPVQFGLCPGSSDVIGVHTITCPCGRGPYGLFVAVEIKTGKATATKDQAAFLNMVRERGGIGLLVRGAPDEIGALAELGLLQTIIGG